MFRRLSNSWALVKASWRVLLADKELLIFPLISGIASFLVILTFAVPSFFAGLFDNFGGGIISYVVAYIFYVVMSTVAIFFNAAIVGAASIRLKGGDPTVGDGLRIAFSHLDKIVGYALINATVGVILRAVRERGGAIGSIASSLVGMAWNIATFLVVPVLVVEGVGPIEAVKRSGALLKKTWGEQIAGNFSIGLIFGLLTLVIIIPSALLVVGAITLLQSPLLVGAIVLLAVSAMVFLNLVGSTLTAIYTTAVYQYAATGSAGDFFDAGMVEDAFRQKKGRR